MLQESKGLFDSFMDHLPALAFMKDMQGRYIYVNQGYKALYGLAVILGGIAFYISDRVAAEEERERLEKKLQRSQRMETLCLLAGGGGA